MSDIDSAAEKLVEPCVRGSAALFDPEDVRTVARWMTLVAILFDQTQEKPIIASLVHRAFYERPDPVPGSFMWLAGTPSMEYAVNGWPRTWRMKSSRDETDGYFCTFRIKHLVAQVYLSPDGNPQNIEFVRTGNPQVVSLWPEERASWPPNQLIRADQLEVFADLFIND